MLINELKKLYIAVINIYIIIFIFIIIIIIKKKIKDLKMVMEVNF